MVKRYKEYGFWIVWGRVHNGKRYGSKPTSRLRLIHDIIKITLLDIRNKYGKTQNS